jgi:2,4-dienoyl-CoA reductase-like NADH-dependent reductase (Old Yellow Enzyme family)
VDLFEVSFCVASTFSKLSEPSSALSATLSAETKAFRTRASVPVGYAGFIGNLADGCALIEDGVVDYIAMARALLADNDLVAKELAGREEEVFRCQWHGACFKDKYNPRYQRVYCCVNPRYLRPE